MDPLTEIAQALPLNGWQLVVHVGAGGAPVSLAWPGVRRLVLVEGDAGTRLQLSLACAGRAGVEVWPDVVVPQAGVAAWHRYNLPMLNGPREQQGLEAVYPRLQHLGSAVAQGTAIADLLSKVLGDDGLGSTEALADPTERLLVFDVPGQEEALLSVLPDALLRRFECLIVRGRRVPGTPGAPPPVLVDALAAAGFRSRWPGADADPLWPLSLHRLHAPSLLARQTALMAAQLSRIESTAAEAAAQAQARHGAAMAERESQAEATLTTVRGELARLQRSRDELQQQLQAAEERLTAAQHLHRSDLEAQRERVLALEQALADARAACAALEASNAQWQQQASEFQAAADDRGRETDRARQALQDAEQRHETLLAELATAHAELEQLHAQASAAQQQTEALRAELQDRQDELAVVSAERDEQRRWHHENAKWAQALKAEVEHLGVDLAALRQQLAESQAQLQAAEQEKSRLRALSDETAQQLAGLQAAAEAATGERQQLHDQLAAVTAERDQEKTWHLDNAKWAQALKSDNERLQREVESLRQHLTDAAADALAQRQAAEQEQSRLQALSDVSAQQLAGLQSAAEAATGERRQLQDQLAAVTAERDQEKTWHYDNAKWAQSLKSDNERMQREIESLRQQLTDATADALSQRQAVQQEQSRLQAMLVETSQQLSGLRTDIEAAADERQQLQDRLAAVTAERDQEKTWHHDNAKWAQAMKNDNERLLQENESLRRQSADAEARSRLLDQEILRAEAQLDLVKDVLLREKNF